MNLHLTDEQTMLRASVARFLGDHHSFEERRNILAVHPGHDSTVWRGFADHLGILGLSIAPEQGGLGTDAIDTMIVMEELGAALVVEPFLQTAVIAARLLSCAGGRRAEELLPAIAAGNAIVVLADTEAGARSHPGRVQTNAVQCEGGFKLSGHKAAIRAAPLATHLIVVARTDNEKGREREGLSLFVVDPSAAGIVIQSYPLADGGRGADIALNDVIVPESDLIGVPGQVGPLLDDVIDHATAALCAEACGLMGRMLKDTIAHARQRVQFNRPIVQFQVLQHRLVDTFIEIELAKSLTLMATLHLDRAPSERARRISAAKARVALACRCVGQAAVQIHGGIGVSDELAIGHYFKRLTMIESQLGSADYHFRRFEQLSDENEDSGYLTNRSTELGSRLDG